MAYIDVAKQSNYRIVLKDRKELEFWVQETNLPGFGYGEIAMNWNQNQRKLPGDSINWNQLTLQVLCDEDLKAFMDVYDLVTQIRGPESSIVDVETPVFDAVLFITTNKNNVLWKVTFHNAWIANVGDLQFSNTTSDDDPIIFTVDLNYDYYTPERMK